MLLCCLLCRLGLKLKSKIRVFESTIVPVLTYGAQTWATTKKQLGKIQTAQNSMLRQLLGIKLKDKVSLEKIYTKTRAKRVGVIAKTHKLKYAGHLMREWDQKWNKTLTLWIPHTGRRGRGRPRTRWSDEITRELGTTWMVKAKNPP